MVCNRHICENCDQSIIWNSNEAINTTIEIEEDEEEIDYEVQEEEQNDHIQVGLSLDEVELAISENIARLFYESSE